MAWRAIQDTVGTSESLAGLSDLAERLYWRILAHSDPWGRLDARPRKLRARCYPMLPDVTDADAGACLVELEQAGRIVVWEKGENVTVQVVDFEQNQPREAVRKRPPESKFPEPASTLKPSEGLVELLYGPFPEGFRKPSGNQEESGPLAGVSGTGPEQVRTDSGTLPDKRRGEEKERRTEEKVQSSSLLVAREALLNHLDDDKIDEVIRELRPNERQLSRILRAKAEERPRLEACLRAAIANGHAIEPYLDELLQNGSWPTPIPDPATLDAGTTIDAALAWQRFLAGYAWDDHFTDNDILKEAGRVRRSNRTTGTLTDTEALEAWRTARAARYPEPALATSTKDKPL